MKPLYSLVAYWFRDFWIINGDPRVASFAFFSSPLPAMVILSFYLSTAFLGPRVMLKRAPYSLRLPLIVYNTTMALVNLKTPILDDTSSETMTQINQRYLYILFKFINLTDTFFYVLRKKTVHVHHVFHHFSMALMPWVYFRLCSTDPLSIPFGVLNSFTHALSYSYLALAQFGPPMKPYLWWKVYIRPVQIVQFVVLLILGVYYLQSSEEYPVYFAVNLLLHSTFYTILHMKIQFYEK